MNTLRTLLVASAFTLAGLSLAQADTNLAGNWKLAVGQTSCPLTLAADGTATYAGDCASGSGVARWQAKYNGLELKTASGETVGVLKPKGDAYAGTRVSDGRDLVLSH
jgi:hypothetical protein